MDWCVRAKSVNSASAIQLYFELQARIRAVCWNKSIRQLFCRHRGEGGAGGG